jgi:hypothetical protein
MVRLLVVLNEDGIPVMSRTLGVPPPSFPAMGLLSALFNAAQRSGGGAVLGSATTQGAVIAFRQFGEVNSGELNDPNSALLLSLVTNEGDAEYAKALLQVVMDSLVLLAGEREVKDALKVDKLRRLLRTGGDLLDTVLDEDGPCGMAASCAPVASLGVVETGPAAAALEALAGAAEDAYCAALVVDGVVVAGTSDWWAIKPQKLAVILALVHSLPEATARDIPVYLQLREDDTEASRMLTVLLTSRVELVILAGVDLELSSLMSVLVPKIFNAEVVSSLRAAAGLSSFSAPKGLPPAVTLDSGVLGLILVRTDLGRQLVTVNPAGLTVPSRLSVPESGVAAGGGAGGAAGKKHSSLVAGQSPTMSRTRARVPAADGGGGGGADGARTLTALRRRQLLGWWYRRAASLLKEGVEEATMNTSACRLSALTSKNHHLYVLFAPEVPSYAISGLTAETLSTLQAADLF